MVKNSNDHNFGEKKFQTIKNDDKLNGKNSKLALMHNVKKSQNKKKIRASRKW